MLLTMAVVINKIKYAFKNYPIIANSVTYGSMCVLAEFSQQVVTRKYIDKKDPPEPLDKGALVRYAVVGSGINSNMLYFWYKWLDKKYTGTVPKIILKKLLLDQFVMTPQLLTAFYISMSIMEGKEDIFKELKEKFVPTFQRSCLFWLPAQTINFLFIPPVARVVYVGTCSFIWINILCYVKRWNVEETAQEEAVKS
ncbi:unnamed protein product [Nezara viridula]|uniref:Mpv17-like protein n=1 Tax=Nezara viridula TaxID=85310 RepID=A0A9P0MI03_NEZVI|nr:unnamed protein product [Nezara viridula]